MMSLTKFLFPEGDDVVILTIHKLVSTSQCVMPSNPQVQYV